MEREAVQRLKSGMYLWDTKYNRVVVCYGCPRQIALSRIKIWCIDAFLYNKPKKNVNRLLVTEHTCEQYIYVDNPTSAQILYGK